MISNLKGKEIIQSHLRKTFLTYSPLLFAAAIIALLAGSVIGIVGPYASIVIIGTIIMAFILVNRQDQVAVTAIIAVHIYADFYLGLHLIAPVMTVVLLVIFFLARSPRYCWVEPPALWLWVLFLVLAIPPAIRGALTLFDAASFYPGNILTAFTMFWLGAVITRDSAHVRHFFQILAGLGTLLAIHTLIQVATGTILFSTSHFDTLYLLQSNYALAADAITSRAGSFFVDPNWNGTFLAMMLFIPLGLFVESSSFLQKVLYLSQTLLILLALLFTYSAGAGIATIAGIFAFTALVGHTRYHIQIPFLIGIAALVLFIGFPSQVQSLLQHASTPAELELRSGAWQTALHVIRAFPLTGVGLGGKAYLERAEPYRALAQRIPLEHPHNAYLELGAMAGLPVLIVFIVLLLIALRLALRNWVLVDIRTRSLLGGGLAAVIVLSINSLSINGWTLPPLAAIGWLLLGVTSSPLLKQSAQKSPPRDADTREDHRGRTPLPESATSPEIPVKKIS